MVLDVAGSYKVRSILNQLRHFRRSHATPTERPLVTLSAGNYGKAFAYLTSDFRRRLVLMPTTAPDDRQTVIEVGILDTKCLRPPIFIARQHSSALMIKEFRPSVRPSVRSSVCHAAILYRNGLTYRHTFFSMW